WGVCDEGQDQAGRGVVRLDLHGGSGCGHRVAGVPQRTAFRGTALDLCASLERSQYRMPRANVRARSRWRTPDDGSLPRGAGSRADFGRVTRLSQLTTESPTKPSARPTGTSEGMPRMVRVTGATVTFVRKAIAASRVTTMTGRRPAGGGMEAQ